MIPYLGDFSEDSSVYIPFNTFDSNDPSASVTATTLVDADIKVHKDGSVTQIVTDGATIAIDFDTVTGNHLITVDTSAHADYATGSDYLVRVEGATVDGGNINAWVGQFSIENRHMVAAAPTAAAIADAVLDEALSGHTTDGSLAQAIAPLDSGTATAGATGSITLDTGMVYTADSECQECYIDLVAGVGAGQSRAITGFTFSTRVATVVPNWNTTPDATSQYVIRGFRDVKVKSIGSAVITAASIATDAIDADALAADAGTEIAAAVAAHADIQAILTDTAEIGAAGAGLTNITLANDLSATMKTSVQTAVDAALDTAIAELSVAAPTATPTMRTGLMLLYMALRNKLVVQTSGTDAIEVYNDAGTKIAAKLITDDGSDYTEAEMS